MVKKKMDYLKLTNLRKENFLTFISSLETALLNNRGSWSADDFLSYHADIILSTAQLYRKYYGQTRQSPLTKELAQADHLRNGAFRSFRAGVKVYRTSREAEIRAAYTYLQAELKPMAQVTNIGYMRKSGKLATFLGRLSSPAAAQAVETLHLQSFVDKLRTAHEEFETLYYQRLKEKDENDTPTLKELRQTITDSYFDFCDYVCLRSDHKPDSNYGHLFTLLNDQRRHSIDNLRRINAWKKRKAKNKQTQAEEKEEGED